MVFGRRPRVIVFPLFFAALIASSPSAGAQGFFRPPGETTSVAVVADEQWTPTGVYVREGEYVSFSARGELQLSPDPSDVAQPAGSLLGRRAAGAPMPTALAGSLIGRVGNSRPFGIGNQTQPLRMPASGELHLGINDDYFSDNGGEFEVMVRGGSSLPGDDPGSEGGRGVSVQGNRHWTRTGVFVREGDLVSFRAAGQIRLSGGRDDLARPAGSTMDRYDRYAPLPRSLAGALIGRVGDMAPFGIGDQRQALRMLGSGELFLGINEDYVDDNSGQFTVSVRGGSSRPPTGETLPGQPGPGGIGPGYGPLARARVRADNPWTPSGLTVRGGELLRFEAAGRVRVDGQTNVGPEGRDTLADYGAPMPGAPIGMLIARIDNGPAFAIGYTTEPIRMPASGRLILGINDDFFPDNRGEFDVAIFRAQGRPR